MALKYDITKNLSQNVMIFYFKNSPKDMEPENFIFYFSKKLPKKKAPKK
jgi:hypothetical protein